MAQDTEKFLQIEESAEKLLDTLQRLHKEANSYRKSTEELDKVRDKLVSLIEGTQEIIKTTHEAIRVTKTIGGPEILQAIEKRSAEVSNSVNLLSSQVSKEMSQSLSNLSVKIDSGLSENRKLFNRVLIWLVVLFALAVGLVTFLK